jgi:hypothetical protein
MPKTTQIEPKDYMRMHKSKLHDDYHNFKTLLHNVIENGDSSEGIFQKAKELINTIQCCASNGHKYAISQRTGRRMNTPGIVKQKYAFGEMVTAENEV